MLLERGSRRQSATYHDLEGGSGRSLQDSSSLRNGEEARSTTVTSPMRLRLTITSAGQVGVPVPLADSTRS
jgi:hypothetical protein